MLRRRRRLLWLVILVACAAGAWSVLSRRRYGDVSRASMSAPPESSAFRQPPGAPASPAARTASEPPPGASNGPLGTEPPPHAPADGAATRIASAGEAAAAAPDASAALPDASAPADSSGGTAPASPDASATAPDARPEAAHVEPGQWPNSAAPLADGSAPDGFVVKGNASSMLFHTPESPNYQRCRPEAWFRTPEDAAAAGFQPWNRKRSTPPAS